MKTIGTFLSAYNNHTVTVKGTSLCPLDGMRNSNYTVKVSYNRMSRAIEPINRLGGKVAGFQMDVLASSPKAVAQK